MDDQLHDLLHDEIVNSFEELNSLEPGSKERTTAVDDLVKLYTLRNEEIKNECEIDEIYESRESDKKFRTDDLYVRIGLEMAGIVLPMVFYAVWMKRGFRFEEEGTYTSTTFRGLFNRFKPTK